MLNQTHVFSCLYQISVNWHSGAGVSYWKSGQAQLLKAMVQLFTTTKFLLAEEDVDKCNFYGVTANPQLTVNPKRIEKMPSLRS